MDIRFFQVNLWWNRYNSVNIVPYDMLFGYWQKSIYDQMTRVGWPSTDSALSKILQNTDDEPQKKSQEIFFFVKQRSPFKFFWVFIVKKRSPLKMHMCQPNAVFCTNIYFIFSIQTFCVEEEEDRLWVE